MIFVYENHPQSSPRPDKFREDKKSEAEVSVLENNLIENKRRKIKA